MRTVHAETEHARYLLIFAEPKRGHPLPIDDGTAGREHLLNHRIRSPVADVSDEDGDHRPIHRGRRVRNLNTSPSVIPAAFVVVIVGVVIHLRARADRRWWSPET